MSDSLSGYLADQLVNWISKGNAFDSSPGSVYVTLWDDTDTELSSEFPNAREEVPTSGWTVTDSGSGFDSRFENAVNIDFGEANSDVNNISRFAVYDASTGGNLLLTSPIDDSPFDVSSGTKVKFDAGNVSFDAIEYNE
jgi:hypothetical protein